MFATPAKKRKSSRVQRKAAEQNHASRAPNSSAVQLSRVIQNAGIQAKLKVGQPDDKYEQEADRMADRAVVAPGVATTPAVPAPVPIPYPNISSTGSSSAKVGPKKVSIRNNSVFKQSTGDEAGTGSQGQIVSSRSTAPQSQFEQLELVRPKLLQRQEEEEEAAQPKLIQRQEEGEAQTKLLQRQEEEVEEELQPKLLQRQEEEEAQPKLLQRQEEEEEIQQKRLQRQPLEEEEEELQPKLLQRQEEEEEAAQPKLLQRQDEEEEAQTKLLQRQPEEEEEEPLQAKASGKFQSSVPRSVEGAIRSSKGGGEPLSAGMQAQMEGSFGADFSSVRVHSDSQAVQLSQAVGAQAFTHGNHIYFNSGKLDQQSSGGQRLLAHELTHVVQQGAAPQVEQPQVQSSPEQLQRLPGFITDRLASYARHVPGYTLLTVIIGHDPLAGRAVPRTAENLIGGLMGLIPFGTLLYDKLVEQGIIGRALNFVRGELNRYNLTLSRLEQTIRSAWDQMDFMRLDPFAYNIGILRRHLGRLVADIRGFASSLVRQLMTMIKEALLNGLRRIATALPGYTLLTKILHRDPFTGEAVEAGTAQIIEEFLLLIGQRQHVEKMRETGTIERVAAWIDQQLALLGFSFAEIRALFSEAWDAFSIRDLVNPLAAFQRTVNIFRPFVGRVARFAWNVATAVLRFIKDALLSALTRFAQRLPGFTLLTVIIGRNPFTGEAVARNATNLVRGFMEFVPGGREKFRNLQESGALDRAFNWISERVTQFLDIMASIRAAFGRLWRSFTINDIFDPLGAFERVVDLFRSPVRRIINFAAEVGMQILEFIFEGVMGAGGARVLNILKQARATFLTIIRDPVGFIRNLIAAVMQGFRQFSRNILTHLQAGLIGWLFGALQGAGLQLPERFDLRGIVSLVLQILGLTYERIRPRLVRILGERVVSGLERTFAFLRMLVTEGPAAAWRKILEFAGNVRDRIFAAIRNWVISRVIRAAVTRLATMFNPVGAVIQAILAIYNTIMFFIERINQILALVESVTNSISRIAAGAIGAAANFVEQSMARTIPVIISFLARLLGLGGISGTIRNIIARIRRPIDRAIDRIVDMIIRQGRRLLSRGRSAIGRAAGAVRNFLFPRHRFSAGGQSHALQVNDSGGQPRLMIASTPQPIEQFLNTYASNNTLNANKQQKLNEALGLISSQISPLLTQIKQAQERNAPQGEIDGLNRQLLQKEVQLSELVRQIIGTGQLNVEQLEYNLEGLTGTYASMPKPRRDDMTADHQPQAAVLQWAAARRENGRLLFTAGTAMRNRAANRAAAGYAINLQAGRHRAGRTYGGKGTGTKNEFITNYTSHTSNMSDPQHKRDKLVDLLKNDLRADVAAMRTVANSDAQYGDIDQLDATNQQKQELKGRVKSQILQGESRVAAQDLDSLKRV